MAHVDISPTYLSVKIVTRVYIEPLGMFAALCPLSGQSVSNSADGVLDTCCLVSDMSTRLVSINLYDKTMQVPLVYYPLNPFL